MDEADAESRRLNRLYKESAKWVAVVKSAVRLRVKTAPPRLCLVLPAVQV
jgi:hypothetical protein